MPSMRVLRFRAPPAPSIDALIVTNESPVLVAGIAESGGRVDAYAAPAFETQLASTVADTAGAFGLALAVSLNSATDIAVVATAHGGNGLTGLPAEIIVVHDDVSPAIEIVQPGAGLVRGTMAVAARATDASSGVQSLSLMLDGRTIATATNPAPSAPLAVETTVDTTELPDGTHTVGATAADRAGNHAETDRIVVVDNTPPETSIVAGPAGEMLVGQVRDRSERPLAGVRILLGGATPIPLVESDAGGNFFAPLDVSGALVLLRDGSPLNTEIEFWPPVPITLTIAPGVVNALGFVPRLEPMTAAKLVPIVPGQDTVLTTPDIPGFEMKIPAGVQIIGWDGHPNTRVGVVAIPVDRSPLPPLPAGVTATKVFIFSFGKVGGGTPTGPIVIDAPNDVSALPSERLDLYDFNEAPDGSAPNRWEIYGTATVSADGQRVVTDVNPATGQRYGVPRFCCGAVVVARRVLGTGANGGPNDGGEMVGEPVDAATGFFYLTKTDFVLPGVVPVEITRTYRTNFTNDGPFGRGTSWPWDLFLLPAAGSSSALMLTSPGNRQDVFARQADGTFVNTTSPALRGAVVTQDGTGRTIRFKDGRQWRFNIAGRLMSQTDRNGNQVTLSRDFQGRVTQINEPRGRAINFEYSVSRVTAIRDPLSRVVVRYGYDGLGRLSTVTDAGGGVTTKDLARKGLSTMPSARGRSRH